MSDTSKGTGRWVKLALALSLAFNLLIVGGVVGAKMSGGLKGGPRGVAGGDDRGWPYLSALSADDKRAARKALRQSRRSGPAAREADQGQITRFVAALRQDPFDPAALGQVFAAQRQSAGERLGQGQAVLAAQIAAMGVEERAAYADRIEALLAQGAAKRKRR